MPVCHSSGHLHVPRGQTVNVEFNSRDLRETFSAEFYCNVLRETFNAEFYCNVLRETFWGKHSALSSTVTFWGKHSALSSTVTFWGSEGNIRRKRLELWRADIWVTTSKVMTDTFKSGTTFAFYRLRHRTFWLHLICLCWFIWPSGPT